MDKKKELSDIWIKASIIGTTWAAFEIVFGSFLHNLKVPFSGNILTAIGIIILISASYIWVEKGLFWRAGLICAIMKTMSPSAVIFGPMIAIFSQALLLDFSVRLLGKTYIGYMIGAMLAMSWNLFQRIINLIIFYGFNIIELYENLIKLAQKQLDIQFEIVWLPIMILLVIYCILGLLSAIAGIKVGRKILEQPAKYFPEIGNYRFSKKEIKRKGDFNFSLTWLWTNIFLIICSLILLNYTTLIIRSLTITCIVAVWAIRYKRAVRQLSKPKFWIFFVAITMIAAFVFTKIQSGTNNLWEGLLIGLQMNFRAVIIIVGFTVLGTELYNPKVQEFFRKTSFKQLPLALELSFESLPSIIAYTPDFKSIVKNPVFLIYQVISQAENRLDEIKNKMNQQQKVFILSGAIGKGKTMIIQKLVEFLKDNNIAVGGIYSPRVIESEETVGYDLIDIGNNEREIFLRKVQEKSIKEIGRFNIFPEGMQKGFNALILSRNIQNKVVIIDEVGKLELDDQGWAGNIYDLINNSKIHIIIAVRDSLTEKVIRKWNFKHCFVYPIPETGYSTIRDSITEQIKIL